MKLKAVVVAIAFFAISVPVLSAPNANASFESLKALAGQWDAKDPSGKQQTITWKVVSGGSVVMESMQEESMVTMYQPSNGSSRKREKTKTTVFFNSRANSKR